MTSNSTDTFWSVDGTSLQQFAWNIVTWAEDREAPPPVRGANVAIAYKPGQRYYRKTPDSRSLTLGMWVQGTLDDGSTPTDVTMRAQFEANWKALRALLWRPRQQFLLKKQFRLLGDDTIYSGQALAEFTGGLNMTMNGELSGVFTVDLYLADPFFYGDPIDLSLDPGNPEQDFTILGDDRTMKINVAFQGQTSRLRISNETAGVYMDYTKPLSTGQEATIDVENFQARHDVNGVNSSSTFSVAPNNVDPFWFFLEPGDTTLGVSELDAPAQSVTWTNLATNPSFETTSGTSTVTTNAFKNPSFIAADPTGTVATWRTNLVSNAGFEGTTVPTTAVASATVSRVTTQHHTGSASISVVTSGVSGSGVSFAYSSDAVKNLLWGSAWVMAPTGKSFSIYFLDSNGAQGAATYVGTGAWQRVTTNPAAFKPGATIVAQLYIVQSVSGSATTFYVDDVVVSADGIIDEEFTGASTQQNGSGFTYAWTGTANASTSLKKTTLSEIARNLAPNPEFANDITAGSASQTLIYTNLWKNPTNVTTAAQATQVRTNLATNPKGTTNTTGWAAACGATDLTLTNSSSDGPSTTLWPNRPPASYISGTADTYPTGTPVSFLPSPSSITVTEAVTYAFSAWVRTSSLQLGDEGNCAIRIHWFDSGSTELTPSVMSFHVSNPDTWDRVSVIGTAPAGAATAEMEIIFNSLSSVDIEDAATFDVTGILFEAATRAWPFFDGGSTTATPYTYAWTGTANASTSTETSTRMVTRINFASSPEMTTASDFAALTVSVGSDLSPVTLTDAPQGITTGTQAVANATGAGFLASLNLFDLVPGEKYTASVYVKSPIALNITGTSAFYSSQNSVTSIAGASAILHVAANTWTRLFLTVTVPAGRTFATVSFADSTTVFSLSAAVQLTEVLIENSGGLDSFFGASTSSNADLAYYMDGDSSSVLGYTYQYAAASTSADVPAGVTSNSQAVWSRGSVYRSTLAGATGGTASIAVVGNSSLGSGSYAKLATTGMTSGHIYTVIAKCTIGKVFGTPSANALQIASTATNTVLSSVGTVAGQTYTFKAVFTWDGSDLRAYNGYQGGTVYWDEISIIDVTDADHPYAFNQPFYGTTSGTLPVAMQSNADYTDFADGFAFTGTANASTSTFKALKPFTVPTENNAIAITSRVGRFSQNGISQIPTCLRIVPTSLSDNASYVSPGGDGGDLRLSMVPGNTYYISASVANTPQSGILHANAKRLVLTYRIGTGDYVDVLDSIDPLDSTHHYIVFTLPVGTAEAYVRLWNGATSGNGSVYWSMFGVRQVDPSVTMTEFPYMTGGDDAAPEGDSTALSAWTSTRWNSASIIARPKPGGAAAYSGAPFTPAPALRYNGDLTYRGLTLDPTIVYNGQPVSAVTGVALTTSTTYLVKGSVTLLGDTVTPFTTDNSISIVWSTGVLTLSNVVVVPTTEGTYDFSASFTTPASGTLSDVLVYFSQADEGMSYWTALMIVKEGSALLPYLNGTDQPFSSDPAMSWSGTANQSTSILSGNAVTTVAAATHAVGVSSATHTTNRSKSLLVAAIGSSNDSFVSPGGDSGAMRFSMVAGHTYTFSAKVSLAGPQTGSVGPLARQLVVMYVAGGVTFTVPATQAPNAAVAGFDSRVTVQLPANTTQAWIRLYNGDTLGDAFVWFDSLLLVGATSDLDTSHITYFDGASTDTDISTYAWSGTADASTSTTSGLGTAEPIVITYQPAWI